MIRRCLIAVLLASAVTWVRAALRANAVGDGLFRAVAGNGRTLALIFHGHGIGRTDAGHFNAWTLLIEGLGDRVTLYGALETEGR